MIGRARTLFAGVIAALLFSVAAQAAPTGGCGSSVPRTAVISAFAPEWQALKAMVAKPKDCRIKGVTFITGRIEGRPVVVFLSGVSMTNAAMTTQLALDHFNIDQLVFSGIAGGADPSLTMGDVAVPEQWGEYLESNFAREAPDGFHPMKFAKGDEFPNFGMIYPNGVLTGSDHQPFAYRFWFKADPALLDIARKAATEAKLRTCTASGECLSHAPRVVVGGAGVSGPVFMDNAKFRDYVFATFHAQVIDMESAALAHVAFANEKPFIVFRSLSDLAGGGESPNQMRTFMDLASQNSAEVVRVFLKSLPSMSRPTKTLPPTKP